MSPLRVGILGAAGIAPASMIRPARRRDDVEVVAVAASSADRAAAFARRHGIDRSYGSYDALLADPAIDLVYVALPPVSHPPWSIAALRAGKHVLCEKPFALDADQARTMNAVAADTGMRLVEAFHDRYHPLSARISELAALVGPVRDAAATFTAPVPFDPDELRHSPGLGGGALMDLGCYPVHWLRTLFGDEPVVIEASARPNPLGVDESITARLGFAGATARLSASLAADLPFEARLAFEGDRGRVEVDNPLFPAQGHSIRSRVDGVDRVETVAGQETYDHQLAAVVAALADGRPLPTEGEDPVATMTVIDAIYAAAGVDRGALVGGSGAR